jgi:DNA-binding beta-propeller fold protein YncE
LQWTPRVEFAYLTDDKGFSVWGYSISAASGALTSIPGSPFAAGAFAESVAVDPSGKFAYVANGDGTVSGYTINATSGAVTDIPGSPFAAGSVGGTFVALSGQIH